MKHLSKYIATALACLSGAATMTGCQDDVDAPEMKVPVSSLEANTTILDLKTAYWNDDANYIDTIKLNAAGEHIIIAGRVISDDQAGNIYKNLVIQDATAALTISINKNSLYNTYRVGQEVIIDVTDMYIGKYSSLQQLGFPDYSGSYGWQATFMPYEFFSAHAQLNGLPEPTSIDTLTTTIAALQTTPEGLRKMQSQLVRLNNVHFEDGGKANFCTAYKVNTNRNLVDGDGNTIVVRTSGYANFWSTPMPAESGDVVGILSYNGSGTSAKWQLLLRSTADLLNFGNPTLPKGTQERPYDVNEAIAIEQTGAGTSAWVKGYIVGAVKGEVTSVTSGDDIEWTAPTTMNNTLVIGQAKTTDNLANALVIALPQGSALRQYGNLRDNPDLLGREIMVYGTFAKFMDTYGITGNTGTANEFEIEGVTVEKPAEGLTSLNVTFDNVTSISQLQGWTKKELSGNKDWFFRDYNGNYFAEITAYKGTPGPDGFDAWLITPALNVSGMTTKVLSFKSCVGYTGEGTLEVYALTTNDPSTAVLTKLDANIPKPTGSWSEFVASGNISLDNFSGTVYIGFRYKASQGSGYTTYRVDDVVVGEKEGDQGGDTPGGDTPGGAGTADSPYTVADVFAINPPSIAVVETGKWVTGYIVGCVDTSGSIHYATEETAIFGGGQGVETNILLASTPDEKDYKKCVSVNLKVGSDARKNLNVKTNPSMVGKQVSVLGNIRKYVGLPGVAEVSEYAIGDKGK